MAKKSCKNASFGEKSMRAGALKPLQCLEEQASPCERVSLGKPDTTLFQNTVQGELAMRNVHEQRQKEDQRGPKSYFWAHFHVAIWTLQHGQKNLTNRLEKPVYGSNGVKNGISKCHFLALLQKKQLQSCYNRDAAYLSGKKGRRLTMRREENKGPPWTSGRHQKSAFARQLRAFFDSSGMKLWMM